ncbi:hypothetical protein EGH62_25165 [Klebsiella aerogenes]|nr:hypothetical protein EGH62_25165 [Klebsiella aerogenes]
MCFHPSMANHHPKIAAIAKALAYRKGDFESLKKREVEILHTLESIREQIGQAEQDIQRLSALIEEFNLNATDIRSIRAVSRKPDSVYGLFRDTLVKILQEAGEPITAAEMLEVLKEKNDPRINLPSDRRIAHQKVSRDLRTLCACGMVTRYNSSSNFQSVRWLWVGQKRESF